ncbi:MAG TPA: MFS transporter [Candidatus Bathyarchaeota archaeon]|nr:MFS transporter [Candidatus Bathyarchaeota archaeon]
MVRLNSKCDKEFKVSFINVLRGNAGVVIIGLSMFFLGKMIVDPVFPRFAEELGATPFIIGVLYSIEAIVYTLAQIPGGYIADRWGRKNLICLTMFIVALSYVFFAAAVSWYMLAIGIALLNFAMMHSPAIRALFADSVPQQYRGLAFTLYRLIPGIVSVLALPMASFLILRYGFVPGVRLGYTLLILLSLVSAIFFTVCLKETLPSSQSRLRKIHPKALVKEYVRSYLATSRSFKGLSLTVLLISISYAICHGFYILYGIHVVGIEDWQWPIVYLLAFVVYTVSSIPIGRMIDVIGRKPPMLLSAILYIPGILIFINAKCLVECAMGYTFVLVSSSFFWPSYMAMEADLIPSRERGKIMALMNVLMELPYIFFTPLGGYLFTLNPIDPFITSIIIAIAAYLVALTLISERKTKPQ